MRNTPAGILFKQALAHLDLSPDGRARVLAGQLEDSMLVREAAERGWHIDVLHRRAGRVDALRRELAEAPGIRVEGGIFPQREQVYDAALLQLGPGRALTRGVMFKALEAMRAGGRVFCVGANEAGARSAADDMGALARVEVMGHKGGHRLFVASRSEGILTAPAEWNDPWEARDLSMAVRGRNYVMRTRPGVFSWEKLDEGTALLLEEMGVAAPNHPGAVMDACCGYGIVGLVAEAEWEGAAVTWADDDFVAVGCAGEVAGAQRVRWMNLTIGEGLRGGGYDVILCNPPFHRGHRTDRSFMGGFAPVAKRILDSAGRMLLVANIFLDYESVLEGHFANVRVVKATRSYKIILAEKSAGGR